MPIIQGPETHLFPERSDLINSFRVARTWLPPSNKLMALFTSMLLIDVFNTCLVMKKGSKIQFFASRSHATIGLNLKSQGV